MNSDLKTAVMQLKLYLEEQDQIPYETLNVVIGDVTYGGRATDNWDKRTNRSLLTKFYLPRLMDDDYKFSVSGIYYAPPEGKLEVSRAYVKGLPLLDEPETFGLHDNAAITFQQKETKGMLDTVIALEGSGGGGGGGTSKEHSVLVTYTLSHFR